MKDKVLIELVIVLILVGYGLWTLKKNPVLSPAPNISETVSPAGETSAGGASAPAALTYGQALQKYENARIQLNKDCQAIPNAVTYKNNTTIMIDNRADAAHTVTVGSTFSLKAYGFKIIKLSSSVLPATLYMNCDKAKNVATILLQK